MAVTFDPVTLPATLEPGVTPSPVPSITGTADNEGKYGGWTVDWSATGLPDGMTLSAGRLYDEVTTVTVDGAPTTAGSGVATITANDYDAAGASTHDWTWEVAAGTEPDPEPDPEPLARLVLAFAGRPETPAALALATAQAGVVSDFVNGYTRGRGFDTATGEPERPLRSVIVSATARLLNNPEQVSSYQMADYSERPAVLNGYTLAELGVLRRYRKTQA